MPYNINGKCYQSVIKCLSALKIPSNGFFEWYGNNSNKFSSKEEGLQHYVDLVKIKPELQLPYTGIAMFKCKNCGYNFVFTRELIFSHIEECCNGDSKLIKHYGYCGRK